MAIRNVTMLPAPRRGHAPHRGGSGARVAGTLVAAAAVTAAALLVNVLTPAAQRHPPRPTPQRIVTPRPGRSRRFEQRRRSRTGSHPVRVPDRFSGSRRSTGPCRVGSGRIPCSTGSYRCSTCPGRATGTADRRRLGKRGPVGVRGEPVSGLGGRADASLVEGGECACAHAHGRLILDLNLVTASPAISAEWAGRAEAALPSGSIAGFEIGNEPDLFSRKVWLGIVSRTSSAPRSPGFPLRRRLRA